jgi:hypothetical protein
LWVVAVLLLGTLSGALIPLLAAFAVSALIKRIGPKWPMVFGTAVATAILAASTVPGLSLSTMDGYTTSFAVSGGICVLAILAALIVPYRHRAKTGTRTSVRERAAPMRSRLRSVSAEIGR